MYLNNKLRMENEQISTPLPVIAEKMPPKNPVRVNTIPCHIPKFGTESKVLLLCCLKKNEMGVNFCSFHTVCTTFTYLVRKEQRQN